MRKVITVLVALFLLLCATAIGGAQQAKTKKGPFTFVFLGESSSTDIAWTYQVDRMKEAADALGINFSYRFAEGDYARHADMILQETARGVDAILAPFWDAHLYNTAITEAVKKGVLVYGVFGVSPRDTLPPDIAAKCGWQSSDYNVNGRTFAKYAFPLVQQGGKVFWPAEVPSGTYITAPLQGFKDYFKENGKNVTVDVVECTNVPTTAEQRIIAYLTANPDIKVLVTTGAICINAANLAVKDMNLKPGKVKLIGMVNSPACVRGISDGYMPFGVNFDWTDSPRMAVLRAWAILRLGVTPTYEEVPQLYVDKSNMQTTVPSVFMK